MLRKLEAEGKITLPAPLKRSRSTGSADKIVWHMHDTTPVETALHDLLPLQVNIVTAKNDVTVFKSYIDQYHYLGFERSIGESMKYDISSRDGVPLASLMFGASAWACHPRDSFIGWESSQRQASLRFISNNSRFLIYPWVKSPCLASHILGLISRRVSDDWQAKYSHPLFMLETFVECSRFKAVSYRAANWVCVGKTAGRGRNDRMNAWALPEKYVYLLPLTRRWRETLQSI